MSALTATCATLIAVINAAQPGDSVRLAPGSSCPTIVITAQKRVQLDINAGGSKVAGVVFKKAQRIRWRSGTVTAPGGAMVLGKAGYAFHLDGASRISINGVRITDANRGVAGGDGSAISITDNDFDGVGQDAMILAKIDGLDVLRNRVRNTIGKPTTCTAPGGVQLGLSKAACVALLGEWVDGFHPDAVQLRNGVVNFRIRWNVVEGSTQGLDQMDTTGDAPLRNGLIADNRVVTYNNHPITFGECLGCVIRDNVVDRPADSSKRAVIIAGRAVECDNVVQGRRSAPCSTEAKRFAP